MLTNHQEKAAAIFDHFSLLLGTNTPRTASLNWNLLDLPSHDLQHLDVPITQEEIKTAVFQAHSEKAPGPDGYTGLFYELTWEIIVGDWTFGSSPHPRKCSLTRLQDLRRPRPSVTKDIAFVRPKVTNGSLEVQAQGPRPSVAKDIAFVRPKVTNGCSEAQV